MSAGVEDNRDLEATRHSASHGSTDLAPHPVDPQPAKHHDHHVLLDAHEDRWKWRAKIRGNPRKLFFYRLVVALAGMLLVVLGGLTGPLPGPGGIPLVLLGIAVWSSEFEWAYRLMQWFRLQLERYRGWTAKQKVLFWVLFFVVCGALVYAYMLLAGIPFWVPGFAENLLQRLPGV